MRRIFKFTIGCNQKIIWFQITMNESHAMLHKKRRRSRKRRRRKRRRRKIRMILFEIIHFTKALTPSNISATYTRA